ncbi:uncharacterized protein LOC114349533 isoform X3 [Diabrotica virgifera virgifera]|uniref:Uncharacterized protein LOC114349533 isoform X2 n=1 Tax=Diabrotica virgifera virgifera TaxID=50390 RepID=A0A6P7HDQ9_DIAVI|nr:uncharacterized protein LOC114349533 isoform X3 [Diabrotica virgifera virgifera]
MFLSQARCLALRLTVPVPHQNVPINRSGGKLVPPSAILLAGLGVGVSSFSLKQMLQSKRPKLL